MTMRMPIYVLALGLLALPQLMTMPAQAATLDGGARTACNGTSCIGSYCNQNGDGCRQESVYQRKANEEVHWVCYVPGHKCKWITGPVPDSHSWSVLQLGTDR
jgi:hypothetical protein